MTAETEVVHSSASDRAREVLTVPNVLSLSRLGLLAWFLVALFDSNNRILAGSILAVAGVTDFLDGYLARRLHQVSELGKVLDPSVDRVLLVGAMIAIVYYGAIPIWLAILAVGREVLVSVAVLLLSALGAKRIEVLFIGKAGTFGLMVAFPLLLAGDGLGAWAEFARILGWVIAVPSLACSYAAAAVYFPQARRALAGRNSISLGSSS